MPVRLLLGLVTASATALLARAFGIDGANTLTSVIVVGRRLRRRLRAAAAARASSDAIRSGCSKSCCRRSRRSPGRSARSRGWIARTVSSAKRPAAPAHDRRGGGGGERGRQDVPRHRRAGRDHRGRGAEAAAEHRRFRRHARPRSDDAAPRHRRHPGRGDDRRSARAVPRAGVLAVSRCTRRTSTTSPASCS